jgi:hypothetical protein
MVAWNLFSAHVASAPVSVRLRRLVLRLKQGSSKAQARLERGRPEAEHSPSLGVVPVVNVLSDLVLRQSVAFLDFSFELIATTSDGVQIIIGELSPLLFDFSLDLFPISLDSVPIHSEAPSFDFGKWGLWKLKVPAAP